MWKEALFRVLVGGAVVSGFSILGDIFKPKRFAGLFGAAPSIALATLALTVSKEGRAFAATEARSMIAGAIAFLAYSIAVCWLLIKHKPRALLATGSLIGLWLFVAFGLWLLLLR
jgi:hypothetical protein